MEPTFEECALYSHRVKKSYSKVLASIPTGWVESSKYIKKNAVSAKALKLEELVKGSRINGNHDVMQVEVMICVYSEHSTYLWKNLWGRRREKITRFHRNKVISWDYKLEEIEVEECDKVTPQTLPHVLKPGIHLITIHCLERGRCLVKSIQVSWSLLAGWDLLRREKKWQASCHETQAKSKVYC